MNKKKIIKAIAFGRHQLDRHLVDVLREELTDGYKLLCIHEKTAYFIKEELDESV